jgi:hypothetical protein
VSLADGSMRVTTRIRYASHSLLALCVTTALVLSSGILEACTPVPDRLFYEGKQFNAWSALHFYDYVQGQEGWTQPNSSAGYHAVWRVKDRRLLLEGFFSEVDPKVQQAVDRRPGGIHADWFSGVIRLLPAMSGSQPFASDELHLRVKDGVLESSRWVRNGRFTRALEEEYQRRGRAASAFWEALVKEQGTRDWVRSLPSFSPKERIDRVLCRQSEMMGAFEAANTQLDRDQVIIAAHLEMLILSDYLNHALERINLMP